MLMVERYGLKKCVYVYTQLYLSLTGPSEPTALMESGRRVNVIHRSIISCFQEQLLLAHLSSHKY